MELMHIPNWLDETLNETFETISEKLDSDYEVEGTIEPVPHESCPGFIPFTNGGWTYRASINLADLVSSGRGFVNQDISNSIDKTVEYCYAGAREQFIAEHRKELEKHFMCEDLNNNSDNVNYHLLYDKGEGSLAETLSETETEWLEGYLFVEARVMFFAADNSRNLTGKDEIYFISGVNLDYDYGRDKGLEETFEETRAVEDLTPAIVNEIFKNMYESI